MVFAGEEKAHKNITTYRCPQAQHVCTAPTSRVLAGLAHRTSKKQIIARQNTVSTARTEAGRAAYCTSKWGPSEITTVTFDANLYSRLLPNTRKQKYEG